MLLLSNKIVDDLLSLTASEEVTSFEVANLQDPLPVSRWRSTTLTPYILFNFASSVSINFWGLWYTNAIDGDQARLRLANSQAALTAAPLLDTELVDVWPGTGDLSQWPTADDPYVHQRGIISSPVASTWGRIDFDYTGNPDGYVEGGVLVLGISYEPPRGKRHGRDVTYPSSESRSSYEVTYMDGGIDRGSGTTKRSIGIVLRALPESDMMGTIMPLLRERGSTKPVILILKEAENTYPLDYMYYGRIDPTTPTQDKFGFNIDLSLTEP